MSAGPPAARPDVAPLTRGIGLALAWLLLYVSGPGILTPAGSAWLAPLGLAFWSALASRPGRFAFGIETVTAAAAWTGICSWAGLVHWSTLVIIGPGFGIYFACCGLLLRRLARDWPIVIAAPAAWMAIEGIRSVLEPPFGLSWMRLGVHWHDTAWLAGSARVWGVWGLSFAAAALAAGLAQAWEERKLRWRVLAAGGGPVLLAVALSFATSAPATGGNLRVLLVQPGVPQERKMQSGEPDIYADGYRLMARSLAEARAKGEPPIDLAAWGETMLPIYLIDPALHEAVRKGAEAAPWFPYKVDEAFLQRWESAEDEGVRQAFLQAPENRDALLPPGAVFVAGVIALLPRDGRVGSENAVALWNADGTRGAAVGKMHLVPGAETMLGLERYAWVRGVIHDLAGYVPDLLTHEGSRTLRFTDRAGAERAFGASVCFDNAYDGPFTEPLEDGPLDFHLVASNEAWFKGDQENDQMMAFSHLAAIATGRSIVRATNSGITAVVGPDGKEVARLVVGGRDREVAGCLRADVPLPAPGERARNTIYVRTWRVWPVLALAWPLVLILAARRRARGYTQGTES